ncbi:MAG: hypothetical protein FD135_2730 [Comamonadaceae bacterium]|nr:MAG: hypothetical protein FD135_2730 [Comamonadaceae bacterium]
MDESSKIIPSGHFLTSTGKVIQTTAELGQLLVQPSFKLAHKPLCRQAKMSAPHTLKA